MISQEASGKKIRVRWNLHTLSLAGMVIAMWYAGGVQANGAASLLAFLTAMVGAISYVHARANLRGLEIRIGGLNAVREGEPMLLPLTIHAAANASPCGLEVLAVGARSPVLVDRIGSGATERLSLKLPPHFAHTGEKIRVLVRSSYPLGLFSAERLVEVESLRNIHPRPAGDLPLPPPDAKLGEETPALTGSHGQPSRHGDDFAGLRSWQWGDSPRHIDWRAAARGRPLMVKTWASSAGSAVHLDWHGVPLPEDQRAAQIAQWILTCETQGTPYAMTLPQERIAAGLGPAHAKRCMDALSAAGVEQEAGVLPRPAKPARIPPSLERSAHLPRRPLISLCAVLLLTAAPLVALVSPLSLFLLAVCLLWRVFLVRRTQPRWLPASVMIGGVAAVWVSYGGVESIEARVSVLLVLLSAKLLESRTPHDFQVLAMIGWFLCLCGLLIEQSLVRSTYTMAMFGLIMACMVRFRRSTPGVKAPFKLTAGLLALALPAAAVLFFLFPRFGLEDLARFGSPRIARTGIPPELDPGAIAQVAKSEDTAFRARFPDGAPPPNQQRYWRCLVMWQCGGLRWSPGPELEAPAEFGFGPRPSLRQFIFLEPHGQHWLPALDWPVRANDNGLIVPGPGKTLTSFQPVLNLRRFEVVSRLQSEPGQLPDAHRRAALQFPNAIPPSLHTLAQQWRAAAGPNDALVVQSALDYFSSQGFQYTLDPGEYSGAAGLEDFLLRRRIGFCGHFSAGFATLMRLAGVPCRVVMGYLGGELSERSGQITVRQSDAHAWAEVWLESVGWARVDPTAALAPGRVTGSLRTFLQGGDEALARQRGNLWWRTREVIRLFWEDVDNAWFDTVVTFDSDAQRDWLAWAGLERVRRPLLLLLATSAGVTIVVLLGLMFWLRRPARHSDPWARAWQHLGDRLVRRGLPRRLNHEGPLAYAQRVAGSHPEVLPLAQAYAAARYGRATISLRDFKRAVRRLR